MKIVKIVLMLLGFIISTVFGAVFGDFFSKSTDFRQMLIFFSGVIAALLYIFVLIGIKIYKNRVSFEKLEQFLNEEDLCTLQDSEYISLRNDVNLFHKARCIYQIRFKRHINWIDTIYWGFMGELAELGVECIVLIHDTEFYKKNSAIHTAEQRKQKYDLKLMKKWIKKISNNKVKIVLASKYYKCSRHNSNFINVIYNSFLPFLVNNSQKLFEDREEKAIHNIRYILGLCMLCNMRYKGALLAVIWSGRQDFFKKFIDNYSDYVGNSVHTILCKTYFEDDKKTPKITTSEDELFFDGTESKIRTLISNMDNDVLNDIKRYAFHEKEVHHMNSKELQNHLCKKILDYQKKINRLQYDE